MPSKRQVSVSVKPVPPAKLELISERLVNASDEEIIRSRLLYEGDQGNDDRRLLTLLKTFHKTPADIETLHSLLYSVEHSYRLMKSAARMEEQEQLCYRLKSKQMRREIENARDELKRYEERLAKAKRRRLNLIECNQRVEAINRLHTRKELRTQFVSTWERKRYFEHLQQTFEAK